VPQQSNLGGLRRWVPVAASDLPDSGFDAVERCYLTAARMLQR
jgi:hypothetical protein